jgi:multimeric flavodoxin WrbA
MKVLMINGSPNMHGCTYTALHEIEKVLTGHHIETEILYLGQKAMQGCTACRTCRTTRKCIFDDKVNEMNARFDEFDGLIIGSPVYYSSAAGQLTAFLDRLFYSGDKSKLFGKPGASVVSCRRGGATATFDQLNKYFTINNMPIVSANYWNQVHGSTPEEVLQDEEGMQTMRVLGENMAWLLKCIAAGRNAGVAEPVYEPRIYTKRQ